MPDDREEPEAERKLDAVREPALGELLSKVMRRIVTRGRDGLGRAADSGRLRLELRQLQHDRDSFWARLGKTAYRLQESGEIDHPAIAKAMKRIDDIERKISDLEQRAGVPRADQPR